jgi:hypothetical protein
MVNRKLAAVVASAGVAIAVLSGCSVKQIDLQVTGAQQVPGTGNLFRFCDGSTLIYFSNYGSGSPDEYEFIVYGGCTTDVPSQEGVQNLPDGDN